MTPAFASWNEFFAMGGYAFFVWLAVVMTVIPLVVLVVHSVMQHRAILRGVAWRNSGRVRRVYVLRNSRRLHEYSP